jgi:hypothetical protein
MRRLITVLGMVTLSLYSADASAQEVPDFSGTWTLVYGTTGAGMCGSDCTIEQDGYHINIPAYQYFMQISNLTETHLCSDLTPSQAETCQERVARAERRSEEETGWAALWNGSVLYVLERPGPNQRPTRAYGLSIGTVNGEPGVLSVKQSGYTQQYRRQR